MTIEDLRKKLIDDLDLEPAFFVGGFGGAMLEMEEIKRASDDELIEIARRRGYTVTVSEECCVLTYMVTYQVL